MLSRRALVVSSALLLAGCATIPPRQTSLAEIQTYKIVDVEVRGAELIEGWPVEHDAYIAGANLAPEQADRIRNVTYAGHPALVTRFAQSIKAEHLSRMQSMLPGTKPARAVVTIKRFHVPGLASRILVNQNSVYIADITLLNAQSGSVIVSYQPTPIVQRMVGGIAAPIFDVATSNSVDHGRLMIVENIENFRKWLVQSSQ
jgi:hypothetical protein